MSFSRLGGGFDTSCNFCCLFAVPAGILGRSCRPPPSVAAAAEFDFATPCFPSPWRWLCNPHRTPRPLRVLDYITTMSTLGEDTESIHLGPHRQRTANFLALPGLADRIVCALESLRALDLNLPSLLYGISWNLPELEKNHLVNFERTSLLCSDELPMLLRRWHKRPKRHSAGQKTSSGRHTMEDFALELTKDRINSEIRELIPILSMPASEFSRGALLGVDANKLCSQTRTVAPFLWEVLRSSAYTSFQEKHNSHKSPDNVCISAGWKHLVLRLLASRLSST